MSVPADGDAERLPEERLERGGVPHGRPQLELRVAGRADLEQGVLAPIVQIDARDALRMAAVQALGEAQQRRERADGPA
jgi:hypothetical protein